MLRSSVLAFGLALSLGTAEAQPAPTSIGIVDFNYLDTSGEAVDQNAAHQQRLADFMAALRRDFGADPRFHPVPLACGAEPCSADHMQPGELVQAATAADAKILVVGGIHKLSTLVEWAKVQAIDIAANRVLVDRLFTFRGDDDEAWRRAEVFLSEELRAGLPTSTSIAVFDFALEDFSASGATDAATGGATPEDTVKLAETAEAVRQRLARSGRYRLVDTSSAKAPAPPDCDGCDAAIARQLGAAQSLVGVVRRISRTEYMIRFQLRDTATGAVLAEARSGLRMGADYSWDRGAVRLVEDRLLTEPPAP